MRIRGRIRANRHADAHGIEAPEDEGLDGIYNTEDNGAYIWDHNTPTYESEGINHEG